MIMRDGIIYDCPNANCRTPIDTGKCSKACIEKYNKEMGIKPKNNADRIRAMSDEELAELLEEMTYDSMEHRAEYWLKWLKQPAEGE
jgi:ribosomal protein L29